MMTHQELVAWSTMPFSGPAERIAAYADPQYHSIHGDAYRQALIVKEALSLDGTEPTLERSSEVTLGIMSEHNPSLEQEAAKNPFAKSLLVQESRLGLSGNEAGAADAATKAAAQAELERSAAALDANAPGNMTWNGSQWTSK